MTGLVHKPDSHALFHLKLVAKIALGVSAAACVMLTAVLFFVATDRGADYWQVIGAHSLAHDELGNALLIFGLAAVVFGGLLTWLFALYGSFRIAGPLYRIARNIEAQIAHGPAAVVPIRRADELQQEAKELEQAVAALAAHYEGLRRTLESAERLAGAQGAAADAELKQAVAEFSECERRAAL